MNIQGISFYDFLGKLIPGGLILLLFIPSSENVAFTSVQFIYFLTGSYLIGLIWDNIMRYFFYFSVRNKCMLSHSLKRYIGKHSVKPGEAKVIEIFKKNDGESVLDVYDRVYTLLMIKNMLGTLPKQEAHVNFLRNIWLIIIFFLVKNIMSPLINDEYYYSILNLSLLGLTLIIPVLWYLIQLSVYKTVWDNTYWTDYVEKTLKNN